jgi:integrase
MKLPKGVREIVSRSTGEKTYRAEVYGGYDSVTGKKIRIGKTFKTAREAIDFRTKKKAELSNGYNIQWAQMEFSVAFNVWYRTYKKTVSSAAWKSYDYSQRKIAEVFPGVKLSDLTRTLIQSRLDGLGRNGYSHESQRKLLNRIKQFTRAMIYEGALLRDPAIDINLNGHKGKDGADKVWSLESYKQAVEFWENVPMDDQAVFWMVMYTASQTGMRLSEVLGLSWNDVVLDGDEPHISVRQVFVMVDKAIRKGGKSRAAERDIPIGPRAVNTLRKWKNYQARVNFAAGYRDVENLAFRKFDHSIPSNSVMNTRFKRFEEKVLGLGVDDVISFHGIRHTYLTYLITYAKMDAGYVATIAGHSSQNITLGTYTHSFATVIKEESKTAIASLEAL